MPKLGINIKKIREKWRKDQTKFAEFMSAPSKQMISNYENEHNEPSISFLIRLENLTGINARRLYEEEISIDEIPSEPKTESEYQAGQVNDSGAEYKRSYDLSSKEEMIKTMQELMSRIEKLENDRKND